MVANEMRYLGIMKGDESGNFNPKQAITWYEIRVMLSRMGATSIVDRILNKVGEDLYSPLDRRYMAAILSELDGQKYELGLVEGEETMHASASTIRTEKEFIQAGIYEVLKMYPNVTIDSVFPAMVKKFFFSMGLTAHEVEVDLDFDSYFEEAKAAAKVALANDASSIQ